MRSIPVHFGWLGPGELPVFNALMVNGKAKACGEADVYHPRATCQKGKRAGWRRKKGSENCGLLTVPLGGFLPKASVFPYVQRAVQELFPEGGAIIVMMRDQGNGEVNIGIAHTDDDESRREGFGLPHEGEEMGLKDVIGLDDDQCPGRGKCHGCMQWCNECGDVDFTCDFPDCDVHPRLDELEGELKEAKRETADLARRWRESEKEAGELQEKVDRARSEEGRGQRMVPRRRSRPVRA